LEQTCEDDDAINASNESFESNNHTKYDEGADKWNPMFGNILSPLQETNEEESQSLNSALSPEALKILNSARQKRSNRHHLRTVRTSADSASYENNDEEYDIDRDIYAAKSPSDGHLSHRVADESGKEFAESESTGGQACHKLSESLDRDDSAEESVSSSDDDEDDNGVEALARNFYFGMQNNVDHEKGTKDQGCESDNYEEEVSFVEKQNLQHDSGHDDDDDHYEDSFIDDIQICEKDDVSEMSKQDQDPEPDLLQSKDSDETAFEKHDDEDDDDTPVWNTPRTRHLNGTADEKKEIDMQSPRTFVTEHMSFLRSKALLNWKRVDESAEQYSDEDFEELDERSNSKIIIDSRKCSENDGFDTDYENEEFEYEDDSRKSLRDSVNKKFRETLKSQLKKELSHSDLFNSNNVRSDSDAEHDDRPARRGGIAFVC